MQVSDPPPIDIDRRDRADIVKVAVVAMSIVDEVDVAALHILRPDLAASTSTTMRARREGLANDVDRARLGVEEAQEKSASVLMFVEKAARRIVITISSVTLSIRVANDLEGDGIDAQSGVAIHADAPVMEMTTSTSSTRAGSPHDDPVVSICSTIAGPSNSSR